MGRSHPSAGCVMIRSSSRRNRAAVRHAQPRRHGAGRPDDDDWTSRKSCGPSGRPATACARTAGRAQGAGTDRQAHDDQTVPKMSGLSWRRRRGRRPGIEWAVSRRRRARLMRGTHVAHATTTTTHHVQLMRSFTADMRRSRRAPVSSSFSSRARLLMLSNSCSDISYRQTAGLMEHGLGQQQMFNSCSVGRRHRGRYAEPTSSIWSRRPPAGPPPSSSSNFFFDRLGTHTAREAHVSFVEMSNAHVDRLIATDMDDTKNIEAGQRQASEQDQAFACGTRRVEEKPAKHHYHFPLPLPPPNAAHDEDISRRTAANC